METNIDTPTNAYGIPLGLTTNGFGFPVDTCSRCDGSGQYSYNQRDGKRCFKCHGYGYTIANRAAKAWQAFQEAKAAAETIPTSEIKVGSIINIGTAKNVFVTVTEIEVTENWVYFTYGNGSRFMSASNGTVKTKIDFDPAPFIAMVKPSRNKH